MPVAQAEVERGILSTVVWRLYPVCYARMSDLQQARGEAQLSGAPNENMRRLLRPRTHDRTGLPG